MEEERMYGRLKLHLALSLSLQVLVCEGYIDG